MTSIVVMSTVIEVGTMRMILLEIVMMKLVMVMVARVVMGCGHERDNDDSDADCDGNSDDDSVESVIVMIVTNSVMVILTVLEVMRTLMDLAGALVL